MKQLLKKPSAWLPIAMSAAALALLLGYIAIFGISQEPAEDEGTAAHLFQLLMGLQVFVIGYFTLRYLPQNPKPALQVLALQFLAGLIPFAILFILEL